MSPKVTDKVTESVRDASLTDAEIIRMILHSCEDLGVGVVRASDMAARAVANRHASGAAKPLRGGAARRGKQPDEHRSGNHHD